MDNIAKALIITIQYLGVNRNDDDYTEEDDLKIIEGVAQLIQDASGEEKKLLIKISNDMGLADWSHQIGIEY